MGKEWYGSQKAQVRKIYWFASTFIYELTKIFETHNHRISEWLLSVWQSLIYCVAFSLDNVHCLRLGMYLMRATSRKLILRAHSDDSLSLNWRQSVNICDICHTGLLFKWLRVRLTSIKITTELNLRVLCEIRILCNYIQGWW
jgi:hypothetical protein